MSLTDIFSDRSVSIALAPELLTAVVRSGKRIVAHSEVHIAASERPDGHWEGALNAFATYLRQAGVTLKGVPVSVVLTTRWCQLTMLPWSEALLHEGSAQRFAQAQFAAIYGDVARHWATVCDDAPYGAARLACAIERDFLEGLQHTARSLGHPCALVESVLSSAWRAMAGHQPQAFALIEPARLVLAAAAHGRIVAVQAQALRGHWERALPAGWQQWSLRAPEMGEIAQLALIHRDQHGAGADPDQDQAHGLEPVFEPAMRAPGQPARSPNAGWAAPQGGSLR